MSISNPARDMQTESKGVLVYSKDTLTCGAEIS
jgi:hypothetical protein